MSENSFDPESVVEDFTVLPQTSFLLCAFSKHFPLVLHLCHHGMVVCSSNGAKFSSSLSSLLEIIIILELRLFSKRILAKVYLELRLFSERIHFCRKMYSAGPRINKKKSFCKTQWSKKGIIKRRRPPHIYALNGEPHHQHGDSMLES